VLENGQDLLTHSHRGRGLRNNFFTRKILKMVQNSTYARL